MNRQIPFQTAFDKASTNNFDSRRRGVAAKCVLLCASLLVMLVCWTGWQSVKADYSIGTVAAGTTSNGAAVNSVTNKIYVPNRNSNNVTIINGANGSTTTVAAGISPFAVAVNPVKNKIYVANNDSNNVTVIDGANNSTTTISVGSNPRAFAINTATNKMYVANENSSYVTIIDGMNNSAINLAAGSNALAIAVNPLTNKVYVNSGFGVAAITPVTRYTLPLNTTITPVTNNTVNTASPTFSLSATSTYSPTAPPQGIYFQVDSVNGTWTKATTTASSSTTLSASATPTGLQAGFHVLYFYAEDGLDATSINPFADEGQLLGKSAFGGFAPESSAITGGVNSYYFRVSPFNPTAASVTGGGRVRAGKRGISNVRITLTDANGNNRTVLTSQFGYYRFADVEAGQTLTISVSGKKHSFAENSQIRVVTEDTEDVNFVADN